MSVQVCERNRNTRRDLNEEESVVCLSDCQALESGDFVTENEGGSN